MNKWKLTFQVTPSDSPQTIFACVSDPWEYISAEISTCEIFESLTKIASGIKMWQYQNGFCALLSFSRFPFLDCHCILLCFAAETAFFSWGQKHTYLQTKWPTQIISIQHPKSIWITPTPTSWRQELSNNSNVIFYVYPITYFQVWEG